MTLFLRHVAKVRYELLYDASSETARTRLLSAGGPSAGKSLVGPAGLKQAHYSDLLFTQVLHWRLGLPQVGQNRCCNVKADGDSCDELLDADDTHAATCACGPLRILRHNALTDELADCVTDTGAHVRREAWLRKFATPTADAVLDVWAFGTTEVRDLVIGVTIAHPLAASYQPEAHGQNE